MERVVDPQVDILFSEFLLNDGSDDSSVSRNLITWRFERVVRRSLGLASKPAFVVLHVSPFLHVGCYVSLSGNGQDDPLGA